LVKQKTGEVGITGGDRSIGGSRLCRQLWRRTSSQLSGKGLDDPLELARGGHLRHLAQTGDNPAPGLAVLVAKRLGQSEIAIGLLATTYRAHLDMHELYITPL